MLINLSTCSMMNVKNVMLHLLTFTLISTLNADLFNMMSWFSVLKKVLEVHQGENLFDANPNSSNPNSLASLMGYSMYLFPQKRRVCTRYGISDSV